MSAGPLRLLFASVHGYVDPSSGAAQATRDLLELLAARGHDCRVLSTGVLDYRGETPLAGVLAAPGVPPRRARLSAGGEADVFDLELHGVRATLLATASSRIERLAPGEAGAFLDLADQALGRFRPHVLLTYGGHPANRGLMARSRRRGVPVAFHLHNFAYPDRSTFGDAAAVVVPSEYARRYHARHLGLECTAIPNPVRPERVVAPDPDPRYLTFVNPQPTKGLTVVARIAAELDRRRPDIPLLVVEGRGAADALARAGLDLSGLANLHRMANTPDPRDFWRVSRAVLVPSLWRESFGRVAAEGLANGVPVLASDRGALPETLGEAGFVFTVPERCTPTSGVVPTAREVAPWIATIERLWDDAEFAATHRARARAEAPRWDAGRIAEAHEEFLRRLAHGRATTP
jgi:glycosyltransferase involved in cell wall biosynthesis